LLFIICLNLFIDKNLHINSSCHSLSTKNYFLVLGIYIYVHLSDTKIHLVLQPIYY
jgi:hypothetical protein